MGLFKKKLSLEEILEEINNLSDDEKSKLASMLSGNTEQPEEEVETVEESTSETEIKNEPVEEVSEFSQMAKEQESETSEGEVAENSENIETDTAPAEEGAEKLMTEEPAVETTETVEAQAEAPAEEVAPEVQKQEKEQDDAQTAKIQALEEKVALLEEKLEQALSSLDNRDFGLNPGVPEGGGEDHNRMNAVMRGYAGGNANRYL